ncbi:uroporphyrinogen III decarboxylase [Iocasia frigidifontis]|uniref:Uroporphyrinogen III decarboxylase n=1 Tax=Iocasia fonsfrigidae TaxID=2682810 RepID=A0A8A7K6T4_9FIRM|nr:uroporphyrinogen decarboxylase family protein [Iocasia fonsfrigidae]QTL97426.1 uroporphyrinogen III decarboxylase [Iocasia fonsfrigidae]
MNKRERVIAAIEGKKIDQIPSCFSLHFKEEESFGEKGVNAHIKFFKETDTDIIKIMNENLIPYAGDIKTPEDWKKIKTISLKDEFMQKQIDFVKRILERLDKIDSNVFKIGTLHGTVASVIHPIMDKYGYEKSRELVCEHLRENRVYILDALKRVTEGMSLLAEKYISLGLDAVYYAALGGENYYFTDGEFLEYIAPLDKIILKNIKRSKGYVILHICKDDLNLNRYISYPEDVDIDIINWSVHEGGVSLKEGKKIFGDITIMGGLENRSGVLVDGKQEEIEEEVKNIIKGFGRERYILGADCTLPTEISYERIATAVKAARIN